MGRRYCGGYRGRGGANSWLRRIALVLFLLVLLAVGALIVGQEYIVYTDSGLRVELPFLQRDTEKQEEDLGDISVLVEPEKSEPEQPVETPEEQPEQPKQPEQPEQPLRAVQVSVDTLLDGTALEVMKAEGGNALVLDMKDDRGQLGFVSELSAAAQAKANYASEEINQAIRTLAQEDVILIARVSCFRDHKLASELKYAIETNPGRRWQDLDGVRWSNPAKSAVRKYLEGLVKELAELGFDEILLDNWGYPTQEDGHLEYIKKGKYYDADQMETVIADFLVQMQEALEGSDTKLSLYCENSVVRSKANSSGQKLEQVSVISGRIWTKKTKNTLRLLEEAGIAQPVVELVSGFAQDSTAHQAVLSGK